MVQQTFNMKKVLELACAAQRTNGSYLKVLEQVYSDDAKVMAVKYANKDLIKAMLDPNLFSNQQDFKPQLLNVKMEDAELATEVIAFYRRLAFSAIEGTDEFRTTLNTLLNSEEVTMSHIGYLACLPSMYLRDASVAKVKRASKHSAEEYLGTIGSNVLDKDCEILSVMRSKNFDAWNIDAIIDNKMVSWMSQKELKLGACVIIKAKIKDHTKHWKHENFVTRLNYVKAFQ